MSFSPEIIGVVKIVNSYAVARVNSKQSSFISAAFADEKTAQFAAIQFAMHNHMAYEPKLIIMKQPLITVIKQGEKWYPTEFHSDKMSILKLFGDMPLGGTQAEAINLANVIAMSRGITCHPQAGISLGSVESLFHQPG